MAYTTGSDLTDNDKLIAALSYIFWFVALIPLLTEGKNRPFQKYHAIQALVLNIALWIIVVSLICIVGFGGSIVLGIITAPLGGMGAVIGPCCTVCPLLLCLIVFYYAYLAYQGKYFEIPVLTDFVVGQGWVQKP